MGEGDWEKEIRSGRLGEGDWEHEIGSMREIERMREIGEKEIGRRRERDPAYGRMKVYHPSPLPPPIWEGDLYGSEREKEEDEDHRDDQNENVNDGRPARAAAVVAPMRRLCELMPSPHHRWSHRLSSAIVRSPPSE